MPDENTNECQSVAFCSVPGEDFAQFALTSSAIVTRSCRTRALSVSAPVLATWDIRSKIRG